MRYITINNVLKQRLQGAIDSIAEELNSFPPGQVDEATKGRMNRILEKATEYVKKGEFEAGWDQVFLAEQYLVRCMTDEQRLIEANSLRIEADDKIPGWRQKQIFTHLNTPDAEGNRVQNEAPSADAIIEAMRIADEFIKSRSNKILLKRAIMNSLTRFIVGILLVILGCTFFVDMTAPLNLTWGIIVAMLFGALGASFSMAHSFSTTGMEKNIPDQLMGSYMIIIRLAIGGTAAFIVNILIQAGLLDNFFSATLIKSRYSYIAISFLSGISERWVFKLIKSITKEEEGGSNKE